MKFLFYITAFFLLVTIISPDRVFAGCASSAQVKMEHILTKEAVIAHVSLEASLIKNKIEWTSSILQKELRSQTASIGQMIKTQNQFLEDVLKSIAITREEALVDRNYGPQSLPTSGCGAEELAAIRNNVETSLNLKTLAEAIKHQKAYPNRQAANDAVDTMLTGAPDSVKLLDIFFEDTIEKPDQKKAIQALIYLTDRMPPRVLTDTEKVKGVNASEYERIRKIRNKKITIPQKIISDHIVARLPTLPLGNWASKQWEAMGGTGLVPGVVDNEISSTALTNFFVDSRIANPNWLANEVINLNPTGLARESLYMQAIDLYMKRKQTRLLENIALMLALQFSNQISNEANTQLNYLEKQIGN